MSNTAPTPNNEALAAKISEYGSLMFSAGMGAASDFRDRHRDSKEKCAKADELLDEIVAALSSGQAASAVPEGWKLVPINPTPEMIAAADAGDREYTRRCFGPSMPTMQQGGEDHWSAMLAASPTQPASAPIEPIIEWIRNNYQDHSIDSLCEELRAQWFERRFDTPAAPAQPREAQEQAGGARDA